MAEQRGRATRRNGLETNCCDPGCLIGELWLKKVSNASTFIS